MNNTPTQREKIYRGAIVLFYRTAPTGEQQYLVVKNTKTGNLTCLSGAEEEGDQSLEQTAQREVQEELGVTPDAYQLTPTAQTHDFFFGPQKAERAGHKGLYTVFVADGSSLGDAVAHTGELKAAEWMTKEQIDQTLTFPDLKEVFLKTVAEING